MNAREPAPGSLAELILRRGIGAARNVPIRDCGQTLYVNNRLIDKLLAERAKNGDLQGRGAYSDRLYAGSGPDGEATCWIYPRAAFVRPDSPAPGSVAELIAERGIEALVDVPLLIDGVDHFVSRAEIRRIRQVCAGDGDPVGRSAWQDPLWVTAAPNSGAGNGWAHPNLLQMADSETFAESGPRERTA